MRKAIVTAQSGLCLLGVSLSLACGSDTTNPSALTVERQYWALTLNHHAITVALIPPYNTLQLTATPRTVTGAPLVDTSTTVYTVSDTSVIVSHTGMLTAIAPATNVTIVASRTIGNLTLTDTAKVNVNAVSPVPRFTTFTLQAQPGDSARMTFTDADASGNEASITTSILDIDGNQIPHTRVRYTSNDAAVFQVDNLNNGRQNPVLNRVGHFMVYAEATVYGVLKVDSLEYTVGWNLLSSIGIHPTTQAPTTRAGSVGVIGYFEPHDDTVAVGATVLWSNLLQSDSVDVVFDDPTVALALDSDYVAAVIGYALSATGSGNIPSFAPVDSTFGQDGVGIQGRRFLQVGTYPYHSVRYGTTGVLHVLPEFQVP